MTLAPGVHTIPDADYFTGALKDGTLSNSEAKWLLPPSCPALFRWRKSQPPERKQAFDLGHAVHRLVLGEGAEFAVIDADDWKTKAAREQRDAAYFEGKTPLLTAQYAQVVAMATAVHRNPLAAALFSNGKPEQSLVWRDPEHGVMRRGKVDWLPESDGGQMFVPDLKTADRVDPRSFARAAGEYHYSMQAACYSQGIRELRLAEDVAFLFVVVGTQPPHPVVIYQLDDTAQRHGQRLNDRAVRTYADCAATDTWPWWGNGDVVTLTLPPYLTREDEEDIAS